jgi:ribosomal protein S18 acetylase RimI-like enzyme
VKNCFLVLPASYEAAKCLYDTRGIIPVGTRKDYYPDPVEDAILMQFNL